MPIVDANGKRILFVHAPKTGGTTIEHYLQSIGQLSLREGGRQPWGLPCSPQHLHAEAINRFFPGLVFDWAFTVVRHPVDRILSEYKYQTRKGKWHYKIWPFSAWLRYVLTRAKLNAYYRDNHFRPQHEFEGFSAEVFRFEDGLNRCVDSINQKLGIVKPNNLIWENRSRSIELVLSNSDIKIIQEFYRTDFKRYGYSKTA